MLPKKSIASINSIVGSHKMKNGSRKQNRKKELKEKIHPPINQNPLNTSVLSCHTCAPSLVIIMTQWLRMGAKPWLWGSHQGWRAKDIWRKQKQIIIIIMIIMIKAWHSRDAVDRQCNKREKNSQVIGTAWMEQNKDSKNIETRAKRDWLQQPVTAITTGQYIFKNLGIKNENPA